MHSIPTGRSKWPAALAQEAPNLAPPPGNPRFPLFDSLRALAALSVFVGHSITSTVTLGGDTRLFKIAAQLAYQGVAIFFLISGFLLYRPFLTARRARRGYSMRTYARRRVLRIVPAYWVALSLFLLLGLVPGVTTHNWWIFYGFGQVYSRNTVGHGLGVAWTLCTEVSFYALLPIFVGLAARLSGRGDSLRGDVILLVVLSVAGLGFHAQFDPFSGVAALSSLPGTFLWFALGMALALASVRFADRPVLLRRSGFWWGAALGASVLLYFVLRGRETVGQELTGYVLYGVVALLVLMPGVFGDAAGGLPRMVLRYRLLAWIGLISYAFYLYHTIVIQEVIKLVSREYWAVLLVSALTTTACAAASYYVVERPAMCFRGFRSRRGTRMAGTEHVEPPSDRDTVRFR